MKGSISNFILTSETEVLVKSEHKEKFQTETGIIFTVQPSVVEDRPTKGEVIQVGSKIDNISIGDIAYFEKTAGEDLFFDEDKDVWYIVISYNSILGISK